MYIVRYVPTAGLWGEAKCPPLPYISPRLVTDAGDALLPIVGVASRPPVLGKGSEIRKNPEKD